MSNITIAEATNSDGAAMRFEFAPTYSWQAFSIHGVPSRLNTMEGKSLSLGKAVQVWNVCVQRRGDALSAASISATIRKRIDAARDARAAAAKTVAAPNLF